MKKIFYTLAAIVLLGGGFFAGYLLGPDKNIPTICVSYEKALQEIKGKVNQAGILKEDANSISGTIKEIKSQEIIIDAPLINPLQAESLKIRTAKIGDKTAITILEFKTPAQRKDYENSVQPELVALNQERQSILESLNGCAGYKSLANVEKKNSSEECQTLRAKQGDVNTKINAITSKINSEYWGTPGTISDLKVGYRINAVAGKGANIANEPSFDAIAIESGKIPSSEEKSALQSLKN